MGWPNNFAEYTYDSNGNVVGLNNPYSKKDIVLIQNGIGYSISDSYNQNPGDLLEALSSTSGWTTGVTGTGAISNSTFDDGNACVKFATTLGAGGCNITKNINIPYDQTTVLGMWIEVSDPGLLPSIEVLISNELGSFTNYNTLKIGSSGGYTWKGMYFLNMPISSSTVGGGSFASAGTIQTVRIRFFSVYKDQAATIKFRGLYKNKMARPKLNIAFDDGINTQYTEAFRYMSRYGLVGTVAIVSNLIDTASHMTLAQVQSMYAAGWDLVGHTNNHISFNSYSTNSLCQSQTPGGAGALTMNGSVGTSTFDVARHVVARGNDQGRQLTIVGLDSAGEALTETITLWSSTYWVVTQNLFTKVNSISIDAAATGAITVGQSYSYDEMYTAVVGSRDWLINNGFPRGAYHFVFPQGEWNETALLALSNAGIVSARVVGGSLGFPQAGDFRKYQQCGYGGGGAGLTATVLNGYRNEAINKGGIITTYMHNIALTISTSADILRTEFQSFIDSTVSDVRDGKIDVITATQIPVN